ncbi:hypothetical protein RR46_14048 [Papilio xuthus]|uniref:Uncharacterized protein n=1 Tax=Papilio xuthus TaxID=66420 RepID=A0A194PHN4_PAPXU|nr:hypothetical protein RR46_14048 [Papilio xuthus]
MRKATAKSIRMYVSSPGPDELTQCVAMTREKHKEVSVRSIVTLAEERYKGCGRPRYITRHATRSRRQAAMTTHINTSDGT